MDETKSRPGFEVIPGDRDRLIEEARKALYEMVINPDPKAREAADKRLTEIGLRLNRKATLMLVHRKKTVEPTRD